MGRKGVYGASWPPHWEIAAAAVGRKMESPATKPATRPAGTRWSLSVWQRDWCTPTEKIWPSLPPVVKGKTLFCESLLGQFVCGQDPEGYRLLQQLFPVPPTQQPPHLPTPHLPLWHILLLSGDVYLVGRRNVCMYVHMYLFNVFINLSLLSDQSCPTLNNRFVFMIANCVHY